MVSYNDLPVLLDTNFVLSCCKFRIHLEEIDSIVDERHHITVPQNVLDELSQLPLTGADQKAQTIMLVVLTRYPVLPLKGPVDVSLLDYAKKHQCIVCTNDRALRRKLRSMGTRTIFVRARSHLAVE